MQDYISENQVILDKLTARLKTSKFLVGDNYTLADTMAAIFVQWAFRNNQLVAGTHQISNELH